jgi:hypothetical protein
MTGHLYLTLGALQGVSLVDSLYVRDPTALTELTAIVTFLFFRDAFDVDLLCQPYLQSPETFHPDCRKNLLVSKLHEIH